MDKNVYAEKFFKKERPGSAFGNGFLAVSEKQQREKPKKLFVTLTDLTR